MITEFQRGKADGIYAALTNQPPRMLQTFATEYSEGFNAGYIIAKLNAIPTPLLMRYTHDRHADNPVYVEVCTKCIDPKDLVRYFYNNQTQTIERDLGLVYGFLTKATKTYAHLINPCRACGVRYAELL